MLCVRSFIALFSCYVSNVLLISNVLTTDLSQDLDNWWKLEFNDLLLHNLSTNSIYPTCGYCRHLSQFYHLLFPECNLTEQHLLSQYRSITKQHPLLFSTADLSEMEVYTATHINDAMFSHVTAGYLPERTSCLTAPLPRRHIEPFDNNNGLSTCWSVTLCLQSLSPTLWPQLRILMLPIPLTILRISTVIWLKESGMISWNTDNS